MAQEIERRFRVKNESWRADVFEKHEIIQGFILASKEKVVRVRVKEDAAFLTIKIAKSAIERMEFEYLIPKNEALELLKNCQNNIHKIRHKIILNEQKNNPHPLIWEVDEYFGDNIGLVLAEIELPNKNTQFILPDWLGEEVTDQGRFTNSQLSLQPFNTWMLLEKQGIF